LLFIQTEETPNPLTLKFIPGHSLMPSGSTWSCVAVADAEKSPLASALWGVGGVDGVFYGADFLTVTKDPGSSWQILKPSLIAVLVDFFLSGKPLFWEQGSSTDPSLSEMPTDPVSLEIMEILNAKVRPAVARDGGDIVFDRFEDGIVYVRLQGACSGCPSSTATLKSGIETMLKHYVPEVVEVRESLLS
ncbi:MAG: NifU family protein, partial [Alphaproteobacteria bacterium]